MEVKEQIKIICSFKSPNCIHASNPLIEGAKCDGEDIECEYAIII